jgi:hypothetical protein
MAPEMMTAEKRRRWSGISDQLERLDKFDHNVYTEVLSLLDRLDLLEEDNQDLRMQVDALRQTQVKA